MRGETQSNRAATTVSCLVPVSTHLTTARRLCAESSSWGRRARACVVVGELETSSCERKETDEAVYAGAAEPSWPKRQGVLGKSCVGRASVSDEAAPLLGLAAVGGRPPGSFRGEQLGDSPNWRTGREGGRGGG